MQTLRIIFKSGHVESFIAEKFTIGTPEDPWNIVGVGWVGRTIPMYRVDHVSAITVENGTKCSREALDSMRHAS